MHLDSIAPPPPEANTDNVSSLRDSEANYQHVPESRPSKRKRKVSLPPPYPQHCDQLTASDKHKETNGFAETQEQEEAECGTSGSDWSSAARVLVESANATPSRASSISDLADRSSPTLTSSRHISLLPLLDANAPLPHHHGPSRASFYSDTQRRRQQRTTPTIRVKVTAPRRPSSHTGLAHGPASASTSSTTSSPTSPITRTQSSPLVTRSNCRFHKISLPREPGGPRVLFVVPGCSIGDRKLMVREEIEDHGDATVEDSTRMVADIELLDFSGSLIGILRQLVGVDLLREHEVYYLPQPGEGFIRKARDTSGTEKFSTQKTTSREAHIPDTTDVASSRSRRKRSSAASAPPGERQSTHTSPISPVSAQAHDRKIPRTTESQDNETDGKASGSSGYALRSSRRNRRLPPDAAAYVPEPETDSNNSEDDVANKRLGKKSQKSAKRARSRGDEELPAFQKRKKAKRNSSAWAAENER